MKKTAILAFILLASLNAAASTGKIEKKRFLDSVASFQKTMPVTAQIEFHHEESGSSRYELVLAPDIKLELDQSKAFTLDRTFITVPVMSRDRFNRVRTHNVPVISAHQAFYIRLFDPVTKSESYVQIISLTTSFQASVSFFESRPRAEDLSFFETVNVNDLAGHANLKIVSF